MDKKIGIDREMDRWTDGQVERCKYMDDWMDGWVNRWIYEQVEMKRALTILKLNFSFKMGNDTGADPDIFQRGEEEIFERKN